METAKAQGKDLSISTKQSIEICRNIRGKKLDWAMRLLNDVVEKKRAIRMYRFNKHMGHRPGMAAGRYPVKASKSILIILDNVLNNALNKGMDAENLIISAAIANRGVSKERMVNRKTGKSTHILIEVKEKEQVKLEKKTKISKPKDKKIKKESKVKKKEKVKEKKKSSAGFELQEEKVQ